MGVKLHSEKCHYAPVYLEKVVFFCIRRSSLFNRISLFEFQAERSAQLINEDQFSRYIHCRLAGACDTPQNGRSPSENDGCCLRPQSTDKHK